MSADTRTYVTTFTPDGEDEPGKVCPQCNKYLASTAYNSRRGKRNGVKGIIRNSACLKCEGKTSKIRSSRVNSILQDNIKILQHENLNLKAKLEEESKSNSDLQTLFIGASVQNNAILTRLALLEDRVKKIEDNK
jgi:hypothetical protein